MPNTHRLAGRFFSVLISLVFALALPRSGFASGPTLCQISDTVYRADGTPAQGDLVILWPAFTTADGDPVAAGQLTVHLGAQGQFSASLAPNAGAMPAGTFYRVTYKLNDGSTAQEFWVVPATQTTTISAIRSTLAPANVAAQFLTRAWADAHYIDLNDAQTVGGVKTFSSSPSVPAPQNANDAANKAYVDANGGGGANLSSPPPIGNVTPNSGAFTTLTVQTTNGIPNPARYPQSDPCAQINAAIGALPTLGGTVDARGFAPGQTCNATLTANKPVTILFGAGTWTFNGNPGINVSAPNVVIACPAASFQQTSATTLQSGTAAPLIANFADALVNSGNYHTADGTQVLDCTLDGASTGTFGIFAPAVYGMKIRGVHARAFTAANIFAVGGQNDMFNSVSEASGGDGVVWGADGHISGMSQANGNGGDGWHIASGGNTLDGPTAWENKLYGLHVDGNEGGDWLTSHAYLEPKIIVPRSNNPAGYAYYSQKVGTTAATRPTQFCQSVGCTTRDGNVTWINVGNGNLYGAGTSEFYASYNSINSPNISESNYGNNAGDWDDILIEGTASAPASQVVLIGAKPHESAVPSYPAHGVHLKYVANSSALGVEWSGGALSSPQQPQPDLGGMAVETSYLVQIEDLDCNQSYGPCLSFIGSNDVLASKIVSLNGGATSGPAANVAQIDGDSYGIALDGVEAEDNRTNPLQRGIANSGSHIVVKNEKYGSIAAGDTGAFNSEALTTTDGIAYGVSASGSFQWSVGGALAATINSLGLGTPVATAQDLSTANFPVMDVRAYGIKGDGTELTTCVGTAGSPNVPCSGASFTSADIGKIVQFSGAGAGGATLNTTVAGCSPSCPSSTAVLAANVQTNSSGFFFYGTDNTAAWCSMMNCTQANPLANGAPFGLYEPTPGRRVFVPRGTYFFSGPISTRNGDQLIGADQSATEMVLVSGATSGQNSELLFLGAYKNGGTWVTDAGGLNLGVRGILFSTLNYSQQVCIDTLEYSGFSIEDSWFECGISIQSAGSAGKIAGNTFDSNTTNGIIFNSYGDNNYTDGVTQMQVTGNLFFGCRYACLTLNGGSGIVVNDNDFWIEKYYGIIVGSGSLPVSHLTVTGNHFSASTNGNYNCSAQYHIGVSAGLTDSVISGNTFAMGHTHDIGTGGPLTDVVIASNSFRGACRSGECSNPCSGQGATTGQQSSAIDLSSAGNRNVVIKGNDFDSPGYYAVSTIGPVVLEGNSCANPFATTASPGHNYDTGCFSLTSASAAGSIVANNVTTSTSAAVAVASGGATGIRFSGNQSAATSDVVVQGSGTQSFSSWNERIVNAGGAPITSQMDPTTGNAAFAGDLSARDIPGHEYFVSKYAGIQAAINAANNNGSVLGTVIDDRTAPYSGPGFNIPDSVTVRLAPTTYTINGAVTFNNGNNNVTAGIIVQPGARLLGAGTSTNHGTILQPANGLNADLIATSTVGTGTTNPQWWHWGEIGSMRLVGNGANQSAGDCLKVENMGEVASVHDIELSACYNHNFEDIGYAATQSNIANITSNRAVTGSGVAFTNLSGVAVLNGISGDCNQTSLIAANFNAAGTLTVHGLKAEAESSICNPQVQDPV
ncbi:MAG TPA: right-handed parallel beta-helix repeat-containing protein, partial [Candidatus Bathyarchaeia archaeon]|nr:right-handed parallel beta-helix repeat-containing protein [Candidatus Bathyarchaeia archaeon]